MTIAIPIHNGRLNQHFGQTTSFDIVTVDFPTKVQTGRRSVRVDTSTGCGALPALLKAEGVDVVLCGGLGAGAKTKLKQAGLTVVAGAPDWEIADLLTAYISDTLKDAGGICNHTHDESNAFGHPHDGSRHDAHHACSHTSEVVQ
ncbi:NifB/NifX family molybdenum-iron cluster-binding protein [soil metagenome]